MQSVLWSDESTFQKRTNTIEIVTSAKLKSQPLWRCGGVLIVPMAWQIYTSVMAPLMIKGTSRFWSNTCGHLGNVFSRDVPAYFSKTMQSHILYELQQRGFVVQECRHEIGLPAAQTCRPLKMHGASWSAKYNKEDPVLIIAWCTTSVVHQAIMRTNSKYNN